MLDLNKAIQELGQKDYRQIQTETAWTWASRSAAWYQNCINSKPNEKLAAWTLAEEYAHEAFEHAALVEGDDNLVKTVRTALHSYQEQAAQSMKPAEVLDVV